jgi:hypothetical protein
MLLSWCEAWGASFLIIAFVAAANPFYPLFADVGVDPRFLSWDFCVIYVRAMSTPQGS